MELRVGNASMCGVIVYFWFMYKQVGGILSMEKTVLRILKIGHLEHMKSFFENGEMCFNTVECFNRWDRNKERFDITEGADDINQIDWLQIETDNGNTFEFSKTDKNSIKLKSSFLLSYSDENKGNIFSCVGIIRENLNDFRKLNPKFLQFGDTLVFITNPCAFFDRVTKKLNKEGYEYEIGYVTYFNADKVNRKLNVFSKPNHLQYQSEIRIWVKTKLKDKLIIKIGSIKDISKIFCIKSSKSKK